MVKLAGAPDECYGQYLLGAAGRARKEELGRGQLWRVGSAGDDYPILENSWRIAGTVSAVSEEYIGVAKGPFSPRVVPNAVEVGPRLIRQYDEVRYDLRRIREIHTGAIAAHVDSACRLLHREPESGAEIAQLREIGEIPHYVGGMPSLPILSRLPY